MRDHSSEKDFQACFLLTMLFNNSLGTQVFGTRRQGCIYIVKALGENAEDIEDICSTGNYDYERFGHSITTFDVNNDGLQDLIIGAPTAGTTDATYHGCLSAFTKNLNFRGHS